MGVKRQDPCFIGPGFVSFQAAADPRCFSVSSALLDLVSDININMDTRGEVMGLDVVKDGGLGYDRREEETDCNKRKSSAMTVGVSRLCLMTPAVNRTTDPAQFGSSPPTDTMCDLLSSG